MVPLHGSKYNTECFQKVRKKRESVIASEALGFELKNTPNYLDISQESIGLNM